MMARESDYQKAAQDDLLSREDIIQTKLNQSDIGTKELAFVLQMDERSVRNFVKKLCVIHPEINKDSLKEGKRYRFKAEWNGLLATLGMLSELPDYDKRKESATLEGLLNKNESLMQAIDEYLDKSDQKLIKTHVTYQEAVLETKLYQLLEDKFTSILNRISMMPSSLRIQKLLAIYRSTKYMDLELTFDYVDYIHSEFVYQKYIEENYPEEINATSFKESLEDYLVALLSLRLKGVEGVEESIDIEIVGSTLHEKMVLGRISPEDSAELIELIAGTKSDILADSNIAPTLEKLSNVLDKENPLENMLLQRLEQTILLSSFDQLKKNENFALRQEVGSRILNSETIKGLSDLVNP